jgi:hypothetical protein
LIYVATRQSPAEVGAAELRTTQDDTTVYRSNNAPLRPGRCCCCRRRRLRRCGTNHAMLKRRCALTGRVISVFIGLSVCRTTTTPFTRSRPHTASGRCWFCRAGLAAAMIDCSFRWFGRANGVTQEWGRRGAHVMCDVHISLLVEPRTLAIVVKGAFPTQRNGGKAPAFQVMHHSTRLVFQSTTSCFFRCKECVIFTPIHCSTYYPIINCLSPIYSLRMFDNAGP